MVKIARILRDYRDAGSLNRLVALWGFVAGTTFLTKTGHVGAVYRLRGIDGEGLTHAQRHTLVHRLEATLRLLDERCRVYQYVVKRTIEPIVRTPRRGSSSVGRIRSTATPRPRRGHEPKGSPCPNP